MLHPAEVQLREVAPAEILTLRRQVLRPDRPVQESHYPADEASTTFHLGAFVGDVLVGCATGLLDPFAGDPRPAYRLRGMAVVESYRNQGIGSRLLAAFDAGVRARGVELLWCNGRVAAGDFYRRHGWGERGEVFETIGIPHLVFLKALKSPDDQQVVLP